MCISSSPTSIRSINLRWGSVQPWHELSSIYNIHRGWQPFATCADSKVTNHSLCQQHTYFYQVRKHGSEAPPKNISPHLEKCLGHSFKILGPSQKTLRPPWCPKLVTGLIFIQDKVNLPSEWIIAKSICKTWSFCEIAWRAKCGRRAVGCRPLLHTMLAQQRAIGSALIRFE